MTTIWTELKIFKISYELTNNSKADSVLCNLARFLILKLQQLKITKRTAFLEA